MTYQRPAFEQVMIAHGGSTVTLRPTLRAAVTLDASFGFPAMFRALEEGNFTVISEIILAASSPAADGAAFLAGIPGAPLSSFIGRARIPLAELVSMLEPAPVQSSDIKAKQPRTTSVAWADYYRDLFEKGTGWLGWTPDAVWNATPSEIDRALSGHFAKLIAIHGSNSEKAERQYDPDQADRNEALGLDPEFDRAGLRALKAKIAGGA
jgi:hypothetical protein